MANDRVYVACLCGEQVLLVKYWATRTNMYYDDNTVGDFMHNHLMSCGEADNIIDVLPFALMTESEMWHE